MRSRLFPFHRQPAGPAADAREARPATTPTTTPTSAPTTPHERYEHVASLRAVPWQCFHPDSGPDSRAIAEMVRADLIRRAEAGEEVYAYQPASSDRNEPRWTIWIQGSNPATDMRHDPKWCTCQYLARHGYHGALSDLARQQQQEVAHA